MAAHVASPIKEAWEISLHGPSELGTLQAALAYTSSPVHMQAHISLYMLARVVVPVLDSSACMYAAAVPAAAAAAMHSPCLPLLLLAAEEVLRADLPALITAEEVKTLEVGRCLCCGWWPWACGRCGWGVC